MFPLPFCVDSSCEVSTASSLSPSKPYVIECELIHLNYVEMTWTMMEDHQNTCNVHYIFRHLNDTTNTHYFPFVANQMDGWSSPCMFARLMWHCTTIVHDFGSAPILTPVTLMNLPFRLDVNTDMYMCTWTSWVTQSMASWTRVHQKQRFHLLGHCKKWNWLILHYWRHKKMYYLEATMTHTFKTTLCLSSFCCARIPPPRSPLKMSPQ